MARTSADERVDLGIRGSAMARTLLPDGCEGHPDTGMRDRFAARASGR
jgi:hypothetical protein